MRESLTTVIEDWDDHTLAHLLAVIANPITNPGPMLAFDRRVIAEASRRLDRGD